MKQDADPITPTLTLPGLAAGRYRITFWNTRESADGRLAIRFPPLRTDLAAAVRRVGDHGRFRIR